jgi:hypothetical protein
MDEAELEEVLAEVLVGVEPFLIKSAMSAL